MTKTRILSMDGGPSDVVYLSCLKHIEQDHPGFLAQTQVLTGTSVGAVSALYFARHIDSVSAGDSTVELIENCIQMLLEAFQIDPDPEAFNRLFVGKTSMYSDERIREVCSREEHLGADTTLSQLNRRVVVPATGTLGPFQPQIYDSASDGHGDALAIEVALESGAFPILFPLQNDLSDGGMAANNPAMDALAKVIAGGQTSLDDIVLLTVGGDGSTSSLSNIFLPSPEGRVFDPEQPMEHFQPFLNQMPDPASDEVEALFDRLRAAFEGVIDNVSKLSDSDGMKQKLGHALFVDIHDLFDLNDTGQTRASQSWGWRPWLAYVLNPAFALQVFLNNQGAGPAQQASWLIGERSLRLAPMAIMDTNMLFLLYFLFGNRDILTSISRLAADLWANPITNGLFEFQPKVNPTYDWVQEYWLAQ